MTIKVLLLKTGEQLVSDVNGMYDKETNELRKYQLVKPCQVMINGEFRVTEPDEDAQENQMSVSLYPWPALTDDEKVEVFVEDTLTMVSPSPSLKEMYETQVLNNDEREDGTESDNDGSAD